MATRGLPRRRTDGGVIVYHVAIATADDYLTRREPHRQASFECLMGLRAHGL